MRVWWTLMWAVALASCTSVQPAEDPVYLGTSMAKLSDPNAPSSKGSPLNSCHASLAALEAAEVDSTFERTAVPNMPNDPEWHWVRLSLPQVDPELQMMEVATSAIDSMVVVMACGGTLIQRTEAHGAGRRWSRGRGFGNFPAFDLPEEPCADLVAYVGVKSGRNIPLPVRVHERSLLERWQFNRDSFFMFYLGIMSVMLLYNLFLFVTLEDRTYLLYIFFLIGVAGSQFVLHGYSWVVGMESDSWLGLRFVHLMGMYSGVTTFMFIQRFLDLKRLAPGYHKALNYILWSYVFALGLLFFGDLNLAYDVINLPASASILILPAAWHTMKRGHKAARFLIVAFSAFLVAVTVFAIREFGPFPVIGDVPYNTLTVYAMPVGSIIEVILLSLALGDRINQFKRESELAREEQLRMSRLNEQIMQEQNQELEERVHERTEALQEKNESLERALSELRLAQDQLVQSEKLASIGQLTAGIAHELNNPINFVSSSAQSLRRDFQDVAEVLTALEGLEPSADNLATAVDAVHALVKRLDLEFTMKEIEELLSGIEDGAVRTSEIVKGLRIFSRMDGDETTDANLNDLLESTLVILRSSLKDEVTLSVDLAPNLVPISCQPGKLNQVFMNLITNAAQATQGKPASERHVRVRSRMLKDGSHTWVQVAVEDDGKGMSEEVLADMFDPFFTTKEVGEGTGLGLSIVRGILDDHHAKLDIDSAPGKGSTFLISFPA